MSSTFHTFSKRILIDNLIRLIGYIIIFILVSVLIVILGYIVWNGLKSVTPLILTETGNTSSGGLLNAIVGTWLLTTVGLLIALPVGLFGAIFIVEYSTKKTGNTFKLFTDILTGIPSIVLGFFGYIMLVIYLNMGYSLLAGGIVLGVMMIPYVLRISEISLSNIPKEVRESAFALGANKMQVILRLLIGQARSGILIGSTLAISIAAGETAQLLYTAGWNNAFPTGFVHSPVAYLTYVVWAGINQPSNYAHDLAFAAAFILVITILSLILFTKYASKKR